MVADAAAHETGPSPLGDAAREAAERALLEDLSGVLDLSRDRTTAALVDPDAAGSATVLARRDAVVAGFAAFEACFRILDPAARCEPIVADGQRAAAGDSVARVEARLAAILVAERSALNLLGRLSGIATLTRAFVQAAPRVVVRDTRKTTPGLRALEKEAVRAGGGANHRMGLFDGILIKDNHRLAAGGIERAVARIRAAHPGTPIEVECDTIEDVRAALAAGAEEILLDNMDPEEMREAVRLIGGRARTEASGGITVETVAAVASSGVERVAVGALTHGAPSADFSLELDPPSPTRPSGGR